MLHGKKSNEKLAGSRLGLGRPEPRGVPLASLVGAAGGELLTAGFDGLLLEVRIFLLDGSLVAGIELHLTLRGTGFQVGEGFGFFRLGGSGRRVERGDQGNDDGLQHDDSKGGTRDINRTTQEIGRTAIIKILTIFNILSSKG